MYPWADLGNEALLQLRICNLKLDLGDVPELKASVDQLYMELDEKKIGFHPLCYLADEWFVPSNGTVVAMPFFLAHPRLKKLEKKMMLDVEGDDPEERMKLLRHEAGHAIFNAYQLKRKKKITDLFGPSSNETPDTYQPKPYSKSFVRNLNDWYAQCDADEDFAETFAVWLNPSSKWREKYKGWKALDKLLFMDRIMESLTIKPPLKITRDQPCSTTKLTSKLSTYYQRKRKYYEEDLPDFFDVDLQKIFSKKEEHLKNTPAERYLKKNRKLIVDKVAKWTRTRKHTVNDLFTSFIKRCHETNLKLQENEEATLVDLCIYLATLISNYHHTGTLKGHL